MSKIHPTALVHPEAKIAADVEIGAYSIIGQFVEISSGTKIHNHVLIEGHTKLGENNQVYSFASIGSPPQDNSYKGEPTYVEIGKNNVIREYVSIHRGTLKQDKLTKIGDSCLLMNYVHIGHDVVIGNNVTIVNSSNLAGHVTVGDRVIISGATNVSQFMKIGRGAYIGGATAVDRDIPPYCTAYGNRVKLKGINIIGLRRMGVNKKEISEVVEFYRTMEATATMESMSQSPRNFIDHDEMMNELKNNATVKEISDFIKMSENGIAQFVG